MGRLNIAVPSIFKEVHELDHIGEINMFVNVNLSINLPSFLQKLADFDVSRLAPSKLFF